MRASSAVLTDSSVRLWDLVFPADRALVARTRSAYIHLDNLIAYSKRDRDGKVHAYLACYRPDETLLLFFQNGDVVNATVMTPVGRYPVAIADAMKHLKAEPERSEIAFCTASLEQLASMYSTCTQPAQDLGLDPTSPKTVFDNVLAKKWTGLLELISNGRVSYLTVKDGKYAGGLFSEQKPSEDAKAYLSRMFTSKHPEPNPRVTVQAFNRLETLPHQATPALVQIFRNYIWDLVDLGEKEMPNDAARRADKIRLKLTVKHDSLKGVGGARGCTNADPIAEPATLAEAVAIWTKEFLGELDMIHPGIAPRLLKEATRAQRFQLDAVDFFDRLPWKIEW